MDKDTIHFFIIFIVALLGLILMAIFSGSIGFLTFQSSNKYGYASAGICEETDSGIDPKVAGNSHNEIYGFDDACENNYELTEYACVGGRMSALRYFCPNGCQDGACPNYDTPICRENDLGDNPFMKGTVVANNINFVDVCNGDLLYEFVCGRNRFYKVTHECQFGCYDGKCLSNSINSVQI